MSTNLEWREFLGHLKKIWTKTERACIPIRSRLQTWQDRFQALQKKDMLLKQPAGPRRKLRRAPAADVRPAHEILHEQGLNGFHELRAAYACELYEQLTGHTTPINGDHCYQMDRTLDQRTRKQISLEARASPDPCGVGLHWRS